MRAFIRPAWLWTLTVALFGLALAQAAAIGLDRAAWPQPPPVAPLPRPALEPGVVRMAGTGSAILPVRELARACAARLPGVRIVVEDSIGSTGGVRALRDGAIDVGLVSRPLRPDESGHGIALRPFAKVPVVVVAHPEVAALDVAPADLAALFAGLRTHWPDGRPVVVLQREKGDSSHGAVHARLPALLAADEAAWASGRWRVLYDDRSLEAALLATPGAVALHDLASLRAQGLPARLLTVGGVAASTATVADGSYPFAKTLAFAVVEPVPPHVARVLACLTAPERGEQLWAWGALPWTQAVP